MLRRAIDASAVALILTVGQGCGSSTNATAPDASAGSDGSTDAGVGEASASEGGEGGAACGAMPPTGTQLVKSTDPLVVLKLTDDDHAVYEDLTTQELYAVAIAGGSPSDIGKMTSQGGTVWTHGTAVVYLPIAADPQTDIAPISAWTASAGTGVISKSAIAVDSYYYTYDASKDGQWVAYFASTANSPTATLTVSTIDGKTQTPLMPNIDLTDESCFPPAVQFVNDTLIAQYCVTPVANDAGVTPGETSTIVAFTAPSFTAVTLGTTFTPTPGPVAVDPTGTMALLPPPGGSGLLLYPLAGGTPVVVDPNGVNALFTATGDILYTNSSGALVRYAAATSTMTTLVPSGLAIPFDVSPDGNWVQLASEESASTGLTNLYLASATTPGAATAVVKTETASPEGFTADSKYSVFGSGFPMDFGPSTYTMQASTTAGGAPVKVLSAAAGAYFTTGSKLVTNTNQSKATGAADIVSVDLSSTAGPTTLVNQADPNLFMTATNQVVYSWYCQENGMAGVWTLTAP
ncbi:MAG TPA: hypothetical protein VGL81_06430 [Polyangiaceae bacterium]|jgi:hypothetical protein